MEKEEILKKYEKSILEIQSLIDKIVIDDKIDLRDDRLYLAITCVSKIYGLSLIFNDEFIKENNLSELVKMIDVDNVKIQAAHYQDKQLFYEFLNIIFPQLKYRLSQIKYRYSLSIEDQKRLIITREYYQYLIDMMKYYLEQQTTDEVKKCLKEILAIINLYKVVDDKNLVALGSEITYIDSVNNVEQTYRIVIDSHQNLEHKKISFKKVFKLLNCKKGETVMLDYSSSFYVTILNVKNEEDKPKF